MPFTQDLQKLIAKYGADPSSIMIDDLPPLLDYIEQNSLHLDASAAAKIMQLGEQPPQTELPASCLIRGSQNGAEHNVALLTIGVHGNEIYAGAIAVLEVLHAAQQGKLRGDVLIQMGNRRAVAGYMKAYDANIDYTARAGWRCSFGTQLTGRDVVLDDGGSVLVMDDLNRVNRGVMSLPRGQHPNVDRAQEIIWTLRAVNQSLWPDAQGHFRASDRPLNLGFVLHPHTSRSPNGIKNLSLPRETFISLKDGDLGQPFLYAPPYMMNIIKWLGQGLGGAGNTTLTAMLAKNTSAPSLIVTAELGNHENIKTPDAPSLIDTTRQFTAGLLKTRGFVPESYLQNAYVQAANPHDFNIYAARDGGLMLSDFSEMANVKDGDILYPVRRIADSDLSRLKLKSIADKIILRDAQGRLEHIAIADILQNIQKIQTVHQAFYQAWPLEFEHISRGDTIFLAESVNGHTDEISADFDFHAIFPWVMRASFPLRYDRAQHEDQKLFFCAETKTTMHMPDKSINGQQNKIMPRPRPN